MLTSEMYVFAQYEAVTLQTWFLKVCYKLHANYLILIFLAVIYRLPLPLITIS